MIPPKFHFIPPKFYFVPTWGFFRSSLGIKKSLPRDLEIPREGLGNSYVEDFKFLRGNGLEIRT